MLTLYLVFLVFSTCFLRSKIEKDLDILIKREIEIEINSFRSSEVKRFDLKTVYLVVVLCLWSCQKSLSLLSFDCKDGGCLKLITLLGWMALRP